MSDQVPKTTFSTRFFLKTYDIVGHNLDWQCLRMPSREAVSNLSHKICKPFPVFMIWLSICFSFWYYIYDEGSKLSSSFKLTMVRGNTEEELMPVSDSNTDVWNNATAFIGNRPGGYKVSETVLQGRAQPFSSDPTLFTLSWGLSDGEAQGAQRERRKTKMCLCEVDRVSCSPQPPTVSPSREKLSPVTTTIHLSAGLKASSSLHHKFVP